MTAELKDFHESSLMSSFPELKKSSKSVAIPDRASDPESFAVRLPQTAMRLHGCVHCDFKDMNLCPHNFHRGKGFKLKDNCHGNGICGERVSYLLSFSRGYKVRPTYSQWQRDFNIGLAQVQSLADFAKFKGVEQQLKDLPDDAKPEEFKALESRRRVLRAEWHDLWVDIVDFEDKQLKREQPKKVEIEHKRQLSLSDIHSIMASGVVDAEFVVEDDDKEVEDGKG